MLHERKSVQVWFIAEFKASKITEKLHFFTTIEAEVGVGIP